MTQNLERYPTLINCTTTKMPVVARSVVVFDPQTQRSLLPQLVNLHAACIEQDNTIATFLPPLNHSKMLDWWSQRADEVAQGTRDIVMCYVQSDESQSPALGGFVTLAKPPSDTGPFRATVEKLLVSPAHRRLGIAKLVMEKVEELAAEKGRTMIVRFDGLCVGCCDAC